MSELKKTRRTIDREHLRRTRLSKAERLRIVRSAAGAWKNRVETGAEFVDRLRSGQRALRDSAAQIRRGEVSSLAALQVIYKRRPSMGTVNVRELGRNAGKVIDDVAKRHRPMLVTRAGRPVAAVVPINADALDDTVPLDELRAAEKRKTRRAARTRP